MQSHKRIHQICENPCHDQHLHNGVQPQPRNSLPRKRHADLIEQAYQLRVYPGMMVAHRQTADNLPILIQTVYSHNPRIVGQKIGKPGSQTEKERNPGQLCIKSGRIATEKSDTIHPQKK